MTSNFSTVDERGLNVSSTVMGSNQEYTIPALNWAPPKELLQRSSINSTPEGGWQSIQITQSTPNETSLTNDSGTVRGHVANITLLTSMSLF